jgi:hypothetical protein
MRMTAVRQSRVRIVDPRPNTLHNSRNEFAPNPNLELKMTFLCNPQRFGPLQSIKMPKMLVLIVPGTARSSTGLRTLLGRAIRTEEKWRGPTGSVADPYH